jgi:serine/threonine protein kinase
MLTCISDRLHVFELCVATLSDVCTGRVECPLPDPAVALIQLAEGLQHVHSMNIVHRDICPNNIFISNSNEIRFKIAGFDLSTFSENGIFYFSSIQGTPEFMAPELLQMYRSKDPGHRAHTATDAVDVFALGCVFYYFLTKGMHPFGNADDILPNIIDGGFYMDSK